MKVPKRQDGTANTTEDDLNTFCNITSHITSNYLNFSPINVLNGT